MKASEDNVLITKERYQELELKSQILDVLCRLSQRDKLAIVSLDSHELTLVGNGGTWGEKTKTTVSDIPESVIASGSVYPSDIERYRAFFRSMYEGIPKGNALINLKDGPHDWRTFEISYEIIFREKKPFQAVLFCKDVTIQAKAEEKYLVYKRAMSYNADFVWEINLSKDRLISTSRKEKDIHGFEDPKMEKYSDIHAAALLFIEDEKQRMNIATLFNLKSLKETYYQGSRTVNGDYCRTMSDGKIHWYHLAAYLTHNEEEDVCAILAAYDQTEIHTEIEKLSIKADRDSLTGLYNRRAFEECADTYLKEGSHALLMLDIDDFKAINDKFGHTTGDLMLQLLAKNLQRSFRVSDCIGRYGGDEFLVIMKGVGDLKTANRLIDRLKDNIKKTFEGTKYPCSITISCGVIVCKEGEGLDYATLFRQVDKALYESKRKEGKNSVTDYLK